MGQLGCANNLLVSVESDDQGDKGAVTSCNGPSITSNEVGVGGGNRVMQKGGWGTPFLPLETLVLDKQLIFLSVYSICSRATAMHKTHTAHIYVNVRLYERKMKRSFEQIYNDRPTLRVSLCCAFVYYTDIHI